MPKGVRISWSRPKQLENRILKKNILQNSLILAIPRRQQHQILTQGPKLGLSGEWGLMMIAEVSDRRLSGEVWHPMNRGEECLLEMPNVWFTSD